MDPSTRRQFASTPRQHLKFTSFLSVGVYNNEPFRNHTDVYYAGVDLFTRPSFGVHFTAADRVVEGVSASKEEGEV